MSLLQVSRSTSANATSAQVITTKTNTPHHETPPPRRIPTDSLHADEPERSLSSGDRVPIVVVHPNEILRLGMHHAWSTSEFIVVRAVASNGGELLLNSEIGAIRVGVFGLPNADPQGGSMQPQIDAKLSELASIVQQTPQIRWLVLAPSLPNGYRQVITNTGASGLVEGEFTTERLESVIMWVDTGRRIGLDEPAYSPESTVSADAGVEVTKPLATILRTREMQSIDSLVATARFPNQLETSISAKLKGLSEREQQVFDGLVEGKTNQQIADGLYLSVKTIETYRSRLKQKLGVTDRASMVAIVNGHQASA